MRSSQGAAIVVSSWCSPFATLFLGGLPPLTGVHEYSVPMASDSARRPPGVPRHAGRLKCGTREASPLRRSFSRGPPLLGAGDSIGSALLASTSRGVRRLACSGCDLDRRMANSLGKVGDHVLDPFHVKSTLVGGRFVGMTPSTMMRGIRRSAVRRSSEGATEEYRGRGWTMKCSPRGQPGH